MTGIVTNTRRFLTTLVVADVLRGFQRSSLDGFDPTYDESPWPLSSTLEAL